MLITEPYGSPDGENLQMSQAVIELPMDVYGYVIVSFDANWYQNG